MCNFAVMKDRMLPAVAAYYTLGCKLNFSETSTIAMLLDKCGIVKALPSQEPDICVVNTCSVTETADKKARSLIRRLHARYPEAAIVVTGCYAQLKPQELAGLPGVVMVVGSNEKLELDSYIKDWIEKRVSRIKVTPIREMTQFKGSCQRGDRTRFFLKVQDGCDYYCSYCTIPLARGHSRSATIEDVLKMARNAADAGGKEIVLTGVNTGDFGKGKPYDFFDLIKALDDIEGIERYRISSIEPNLLSRDIIDWVATQSRAFMPHFHIPLQSGSDEVLKLMRRRYDTALFAEKIQYIRELMPDAFIGVDIIAGARGETPQRWEESLQFAAEMPVTRYHVFPYSERPDTKALTLDNIVSQRDKHLRVAELQKISDRKLRAFAQQNIGTTRKVLWESKAASGMMQGLTDNYLRVQAPMQESLLNTVTPVRLKEILSDAPQMIAAML